MSFFRRHAPSAPRPQSQQPDQQSPAATFDIGQLVQTLLVDSVKSHTEMSQALTSSAMETIRTCAEISQNALQHAGRIRGGRIRAKSAKRKGGKFAAGCVLCENPALPDPSKEEIIAHSGHQRRQDAAESTAEARRGLPVTIQTDPRTGDEVIECEECGAPHAEGSPHADA